jgi:hypothetical protein
VITRTTKIKPKPCPFCRFKGIRFCVQVESAVVWCPCCGIDGPRPGGKKSHSVPEAMRLWNRRAA